MKSQNYKKAAIITTHQTIVATFADVSTSSDWIKQVMSINYPSGITYIKLKEKKYYQYSITEGNNSEAKRQTYLSYSQSPLATKITEMKK